MATFLTKQQEKTIIEAIQQAEESTSGEVRVHIENRCKSKDPVDRAKEVFAKLGMHKTALKNGVIIYVAVKDHKLAIWGDEGIHTTVGQSFWEDEIELMKKYFIADDFETGLRDAILMVGEKLREFFPYHSDDINELKDDLSYGDDHD